MAYLACFMKLVSIIIYLAFIFCMGGLHMKGIFYLYEKPNFYFPNYNISFKHNSP